MGKQSENACLALCMLPMYLHADRTDLKQEYQPAKEQNTRSAQPIRRAPISSLSLSSALRSDKSGGGTTIIATVMQTCRWAGEKRYVKDPR